jgi:hypothetical protein
MKASRFIRPISAVLVSTLFCASAFAQYSGGTSTPSYGKGKAAAVGVGAAAAGAGVLYLTLRHRGQLTGCVQGGDDGFSLVDNKNHQTYSLMPGAADLRSGQIVELQGARSKDSQGVQTFRVNKVVKILGSCGTQSASAR